MRRLPGHRCDALAVACSSSSSSVITLSGQFVWTPYLSSEAHAAMQQQQAASSGVRSADAGTKREDRKLQAAAKPAAWCTQQHEAYHDDMQSCMQRQSSHPCLQQRHCSAFPPQALICPSSHSVYPCLTTQHATQALTSALPQRLPCCRVPQPYSSILVPRGQTSCVR